MNARVIGLLFLLVSLRGFSQKADSLYEFKSFYLTWENDVFTATDRYYSQGIFLQYEHRNLKIDWLKPFFFRVQDMERNLQTGILQRGFTPSTILSDTLLEGDRPYAATIVYGVQFYSRSRSKHYVLNWGVNSGFIGKPAFGEYTQKTIHQWIDSPKPYGWQHQLNTGFIMDANFGLRKTFFDRSRWVRMEIGDLITLGNLTNDIRINGLVKLGYIGLRQQYYFYYTPELRIVAYDGTLQGAIFAKPSEAALPASSIERLVSEQQIGIYLRYYRFFATAHVHFQSRLFKGALNHMWGGITLGYLLWDNYNK